MGSCVGGSENNSHEWSDSSDIDSMYEIDTIAQVFAVGIKLADAKDLAKTHKPVRQTAIPPSSSFVTRTDNEY